ncbi:MAG: hypothetical protein RQ757_02235 [Pseudomonadales bacterium]|nr:hypothetical protein [Pseudomonadales bacterium]
MNKFVLKLIMHLRQALLVIGIMLCSSIALAQGNSGNAPGKNKNLGHNNASDGVMAMIKSNRQIFYDGDPLAISIRFPRGSDLVSSGEVDAFVLIFQPDAEIIVVPVSAIASTEDAKLFELDVVEIETLPEGVYQFGVVLTVADGNPLDLSDWYNGLLGLVTVSGLTVSGEALDVDMDGDGMVDDDSDGDGFADEEPEDEEPVEEETEEETEEEVTG